MSEEKPAKPAPDDEWVPRFNPWTIAMTVTLATFMEVLDTSIANVALPHIAGSLSASVDESTWVLTSYLVANAVVLPLSAWISDRMGRKRFYMTCVALFTISSFCCAISTSLAALIFFRVLQGIGGGGLAPSEQSILADTFSPARRGLAFAVYGMAVVLAPAIGPTLGGYITDHYSWHWIFLINVPVGILSLFLTSYVVEDPPHIIETKEKTRGIPIDYIGAGLVALGLGSLEVVLDKGQEEDWFGSHFIVGFSIVSLLALAYFIVWEWKQKHPVVNLRLFKNPSFAASNTLMFILGATLFGTTVLIPEFLQTLMGYTAQDAGMALSPGGFVVLLILPMVGRLVSKVDPRYLITFGFLVLGASLFHMTNIYLGIDFRTAMFYRIYQSIGLAFLFVPINTISFIGIPPKERNQVSSMINLFRNLGGSVGISFITTLLARRAQVHQNYLAARLSNDDPLFRSTVADLTTRLAHAGSNLPQAMQQGYGQIYRSLVQQSTVLAYVDTVRVLGMTCFLVIPLVFLAKRPKPGQMPMAH